jgi:hypothetical protein
MSSLRTLCIVVSVAVCLCAVQGVAKDISLVTWPDAAVVGAAFIASQIPPLAPVAPFIAPTYLGMKLGVTALANYVVGELETVNFPTSGPLGLLSYRTPTQRVSDTLGLVFDPLGWKTNSKSSSTKTQVVGKSTFTLWDLFDDPAWLSAGRKTGGGRGW